MRSNIRFQVGLIGSGSWATAIAKILTDNHFRIHWLMPKAGDVEHFKKYRHPPRYLTSVRFDLRKLDFCSDAAAVARSSEWVIICMPAVFLEMALRDLPREIFIDKYIVSGVKGMLPGRNLLLNDYLKQDFGVPAEKYFCITGPCHAEEVAAEKLSFITISGQDRETTEVIAGRFTTGYLKTIVNNDVWGTQYAAVLKNVYAIGAGIAHGLGYGDNFLAVYVCNCAAELAGFTRTVSQGKHPDDARSSAFASAYLGDLLVTCYSQYSRNRTFGTMVGKGYSVQSAQLEMNMIAEGYYAAKCLHELNKSMQAPAPVAEGIYHILWQHRPPAEVFHKFKRLFV
ncbi:MAG TPA: NAD(P)H-dependent glycerol-3-phosphate dehydrogenase [Chitinophagaceae bacterium]|nr:NAD(P)H-dependent glycerol-3-phosphate dehydrogenase [Chitinophagaceae bacterium]